MGGVAGWVQRCAVNAACYDSPTACCACTPACTTPHYRATLPGTLRLCLTAYVFTALPRLRCRVLEIDAKEWVVRLTTRSDDLNDDAKWELKYRPDKL